MAPDGFTTTTRQQFEAQFGCDIESSAHDPFSLHAAIMLLSEAHGLKLDMSRYDNMCVGLPFNLAYDMWHRRNANTNGMFDTASSENLDWHDEYDGIIADAIGTILTEALPTWATPDRLRFTHRRLDVLDAEILSVECSFEISSNAFFLHFELDTGQGGLRIFLEPAPNPTIEALNLACEIADEAVEYTWNPETREWDALSPIWTIDTRRQPNGN